MVKQKSNFSARLPDFFIIGAPKCGTTSLAGWLEEHPEVFMCQPKEPDFFSVDICSWRAVETLEAYRALFAPSDGGHAAVGEASTSYLRSRVAVPQILSVIPRARFIVCLRNPVEMVASVHAQWVLGGREPEKNLERAWSLQAERCDASSLTVLHADDMQYGEVCRLGAQVERLLERVPRRRVHFVFLDDLARQPREAYLQTLEFLGVADDGRQHFDPRNTRAAPRAQLISRAMLAGMMLKNRLKIRRSLGIGRWLGPWLRRKVSEEDRILPVMLRRRLETYFEADIELLGRLCDRDVSHWLKHSE